MGTVLRYGRDGWHCLDTENLSGSERRKGSSPAQVAELRQALDAARQEVRDKAAIMAERDLYLRELEEFWVKRIADADKNGTDFGAFIAELE
jgi:hypothetical protein